MTQTQTPVQLTLNFSSPGPFADAPLDSVPAPVAMNEITIVLIVGAEYAGDGDWDVDSLSSLAAELEELYPGAVIRDYDRDGGRYGAEYLYVDVPSTDVPLVERIVSEYGYAGEIEISVA